MARIKFGHLVSEAHGKLNGSYFARSSGTPSLRAKSSGVNRASHTMHLQRGLFAAAARSWSSLTPQQRTDWQSYALATLQRSRSGAQLTGQAAYCKANLIIKSQNPAAPFITSPSYLRNNLRWISLVFTASAAAQTFSLNRQFAGGTASARGHYFYSPPLSPGQSQGKYKLYRLAAAALNAVGVTDHSAIWIQKFGRLQEGQVINVLVTTSRSSTGTTGPSIQAQCVVGP